MPSTSSIGLSEREHQLVLEEINNAQDVYGDVERKRTFYKEEVKLKVCLSYNKSHWSNEKEMIRLLDEVIAPYVDKVKEDLNLPADSKALLIWDAFKAQSCPNVIDKLESLDIVSVMVPLNMTHLLQPLDLTTNTTNTVLGF